jgi:hypothetical protein
MEMKLIIARKLEEACGTEDNTRERFIKANASYHIGKEAIRN